MRLSKSLLSTLVLSVALGVSSNEANATERQFSFGLISTPDASHDIGGTNTNPPPSQTMTTRIHL